MRQENVRFERELSCPRRNVCWSRSDAARSRSAAGDVVRRNKAAQLAAFEFVMGTNRNMKKEEARQAVISEYGRWAKKHPNDARMMGGFLFFRYLQKERYARCEQPIRC